MYGSKMFLTVFLPFFSSQFNIFVRNTFFLIMYRSMTNSPIATFLLLFVTQSYHFPNWSYFILIVTIVNTNSHHMIPLKNILLLFCYFLLPIVTLPEISEPKITKSKKINWSQMF